MNSPILTIHYLIYVSKQPVCAFSCESFLLGFLLDFSAWYKNGKSITKRNEVYSKK